MVGDEGELERRGGDVARSPLLARSRSGERTPERARAFGPSAAASAMRLAVSDALRFASSAADKPAAASAALFDALKERPVHAGLPRRLA